MAKQVNFRPKVKSINIANEELTKITLEVKNNSLDGKLDELRKFSNKVVTVIISEETIGYTLPINKQTKKPNIEYVVNSDGTIEILKEEQTSLDIGDGVEEVENIEFLVPKEIVDEFIKKATTLQLPESVTVNIRDVLIRLEEGDNLNEIAADHELSETALIDQIELARQHFAPFADSWSKHKDDIIFSEE